MDLDEYGINELDIAGGRWERFIKIEVEDVAGFGEKCDIAG